MPTPMLLRRSGAHFRGQGIEVGDGRDESREFGRPHILLWSRVGLVVEEKGVRQMVRVKKRAMEYIMNTKVGW